MQINFFDDTNLMSVWSALFPVNDTCNEVERDFSESLVQELYYQVTEHFIRISFVEALHEVKEKLPKTKKQALRAKIQGATKVKVTVKPELKRKDVEATICRFVVRFVLRNHSAFLKVASVATAAMNGFICPVQR